MNQKDYCVTSCVTKDMLCYFVWVMNFNFVRKSHIKAQLNKSITNDRKTRDSYNVTYPQTYWEQPLWVTQLAGKHLPLYTYRVNALRTCGSQIPATLKFVGLSKLETFSRCSRKVSIVTKSAILTILKVSKALSHWNSTNFLTHFSADVFYCSIKKKGFICRKDCGWPAVGR